MYKLLITDLNGTALRPGMTSVSNAVRRAAALAADSGLTISIATGLPGAEMEEIANALCVHGPCIVNGGSQIYKPGSKEFMFDARITRAQLHLIDEAIGPIPYAAVTDGGPDAGTLRERLGSLDEPGVLRFVGIPAGEEGPLLENLREVSGVVVALVEGRRPGVVHIQVTPDGASKGAAVRKLMAIYGVVASEVVAVGDSGSDIDMFLQVGLPIAMADAADYVQNEAAVIAPSANDNGLAWVLSELTKDPSGTTLRKYSV